MADTDDSMSSAARNSLAAIERAFVEARDRGDIAGTVELLKDPSYIRLSVARGRELGQKWNTSFHIARLCADLDAAQKLGAALAMHAHSLERRLKRLEQRIAALERTETTTSSSS